MKNQILMDEYRPFAYTCYALELSAGLNRMRLDLAGCETVF